MIYKISSVFILSYCVLLSSCYKKNQEPVLTKISLQEVQPAFNCINQPQLNPMNLPGDSPLQDQASFNCFAWQEFIALNWTVNPDSAGIPDTSVKPENFGNSGDTSFLVWETYKSYHDVFLDSGKTPSNWGISPTLPKSCQEISRQDGSKSNLRAMLKPSKFFAEFVGPEDTEEAFPFNAPNWLADTNGNLVWYEMIMNKDEFEYILQNKYYQKQAQLDSVKKGTHINLPQGQYNGSTGAMELKSAWLKIDSPKEWPKHKVSKAFVFNSQDSSCSTQYFALVGLHIIHKTTSQPQWVWATFEHMDNAPDLKDTAITAGKTFFSDNCVEKNIPAKCSSSIAKTSCVPNTSPAYYIKDSICDPYPIQVARQIPISSSATNPVAQLNLAVQNMIKAANPNSVWQYYELVNVLWSVSPDNPNGPGTNPPKVPLSTSGMTPNPTTQPVANTTGETYIQKTTCIECHRSAEIAGGNSGFASDFSFLIGKAK